MGETVERNEKGVVLSESGCGSCSELTNGYLNIALGLLLEAVETAASEAGKSKKRTVGGALCPHRTNQECANVS